MGNINDTDALIEKKPKATQLLYAAETGNLDLLEKLLKDHTTFIDIDIANSSAFTPLFLAAKEGHAKCVKALLKAGARVDGVGEKNTALTPIWVATYAGHEECVDYLIQADANLNTKYPETPLYIASREGRSGCLKLLISAGSDLEVRNSKGQTPLLLACKGLHHHCVDLLVSAGSDINVVDRPGHTPLCYACCYADDGNPIIKMLLNAGADVNQTICVRQEALTALHVCASRGNIMSALLLLQYGAKVHVKDVSGRTPKEMIVCHQPERFLELLEFYAGYIHPLKLMCCWRIRKSLGSTRLCTIPDLPIPRTLQRYLTQHELWDS